MAEKIVPGARGLLAREVKEANCLVSWKGSDDAVTSVGPFPRERAEALVQVYGRMYPGQTWIQPLAPEVEAFHSGVRRSTRIPRFLRPESAH